MHNRTVRSGPEKAIGKDRDANLEPEKTINVRPAGGGGWWAAPACNGVFFASQVKIIFAIPVLQEDMHSSQTTYIFPRRKKKLTLDQVDPQQRILLENRSMTTSLLERLTGTIITAAPRNTVRRNVVVRYSLLTGSGGIVLVFARSVINASLLPEAALMDVFKGNVPLGRIFARHVPENRRRNYSYFLVDDGRLTPFMYGRLAAASPACGDSRPGFPGRSAAWAGSLVAEPPGAVFPVPAQERNVVQEFPARSYDIFAGSGRLAHITEIFSPQIRSQWQPAAA